MPPGLTRKRECHRAFLERPPTERRQRETRLLLVAAIAALSLTLVPVASAHTLTQSRAEARGAIEAQNFLDEDDDYWGVDCDTRISARAFRCIIASYDEDDDVGCDAYVRISFRSRTSRRTKAGSWYAVDCYDGDPYDLASFSASSARLDK